MNEEQKIKVTEIITHAVDGLITIDESVVKIAVILDRPVEQAAE